MDEFRAIQRKKSYVEVVEQLQELIEQGTLAPGQRLPPERDLAQRMGISRATLREALAALEILGYLKVVNGRGIFVAKWQSRPRSAGVSTARWVPDDADSPFHVLEVRRMLEPPAAALAAERIGPEELAQLQRLQERMQREVRATGRLPSDADYEFHLVISRASGNPLHFSLMRLVIERMEHPLWTRLKGATYERPGRGDLYVSQHRAVVEAISARDPEAARAAMALHLDQVEADLLADGDDDVEAVSPDPQRRTDEGPEEESRA